MYFSTPENPLAPQNTNDYVDGMPRPRGRPALSDDMIRKSVSLPASLWDALNEARKQWPGKVPTEAGALRILLEEALQARGVLPNPAVRQRRKKGKDQRNESSDS